MEQHSCLSFAIDCDVLWKGLGVTIAGFILFVGSVYMLLAAIFGRWMGYLVLAVAFFGWMTIQSGLWLFGFWSQGPDTKTNLGPRGPDATWVVDSAGLDPGRGPRGAVGLSERRVSGARRRRTPRWRRTSNRRRGWSPPTSRSRPTSNSGSTRPRSTPSCPTQFVIDDLRFASADDGTRLAVAQAHYSGGGPSTTVSLHFDGGQVWHYSAMFLAISLILFIVHIPLLDRAERTRKEFLVGGSAPPWYGPA